MTLSGKGLKLFRFAVPTSSRFPLGCRAHHCLSDQKSAVMTSESPCWPQGQVPFSPCPQPHCSLSHHSACFLCGMCRHLKWLFSFIWLLDYFKDKSIYLETLSVFPANLTFLELCLSPSRYSVDICFINVKYKWFQYKKWLHVSKRKIRHQNRGEDNTIRHPPNCHSQEYFVNFISMCIETSDIYIFFT